jgi:hypothetical protein
MADLRTGHDYHLAEVKPLRSDKRLTGFQAFCDACGWIGPVRTARDAALDDAAAHDNTENEGA